MGWLSRPRERTWRKREEIKRRLDVDPANATLLWLKKDSDGLEGTILQKARDRS